MKFKPWLRSSPLQGINGAKQYKINRIYSKKACLITYREEIMRLHDVHCTEISALNLSYQELSKGRQEDLTQRDAPMKELEAKLACVKKLKSGCCI